jgi:hypothetical protein
VGDDAAREICDVVGSDSIRRGAVAQLTALILSPTFHRTRRQQGAGMSPTRSERRHTACETYNIGWRIPHDRRAVAQLAILVAPPTFRTAAVRQRTGMAPASRDRGNPARQPVHIDRLAFVSSGSVTQLAFMIISPTLHAADGGEDTGMLLTRGRRPHIVLQVGYIHRRHSILPATVSELEVVVASPTL